MSHPYYGNRVRRNPVDWSAVDEADALGEGLADIDPITGEDDEPWWSDVVTGSVSIIDKIIGAATGQTDQAPASADVKVDPFVGTDPKTGIPTWVWLAGAAGAAFFIFRRRK